MRIKVNTEQKLVIKGVKYFKSILDLCDILSQLIR